MVTWPRGRRILRWALALAIGAAAALLVLRRRPAEVAEPPATPLTPAPPAPPAPPPPPARHSAGLLALALALTAIAAAIALVFTRTPPVPVSIRPAPSPSVRPFPSPSYPPDPPCRMTGDPLPRDAYPSLPPGGVIPPGELGFPPCWTGEPGQTATLSTGGRGRLIEVTATRVPKSRTTFRLHLTYAGIEPFGLNVRPVVWGSFEAGGWRPARAARFPWLWVKPGRDVTRTVTFDGGDRPARLRVSVHPEGNSGTAEWDLL